MTIVMPWSRQKATESVSRIEPPGWMTASIPAFKVEAEAAGFFDGVAEGIDARCLAYARCYQLAVAGKNDGVAL